MIFTRERIFESLFRVQWGWFAAAMMLIRKVVGIKSRDEPRLGHKGESQSVVPNAKYVRTPQACSMVPVSVASRSPIDATKLANMKMVQALAVTMAQRCVIRADGWRWPRIRPAH